MKTKYIEIPVGSEVKTVTMDDVRRVQRCLGRIAWGEMKLAEKMLIDAILSHFALGKTPEWKDMPDDIDILNALEDLTKSFEKVCAGLKDELAERS